MVVFEDGLPRKTRVPAVRHPRHRRRRRRGRRRGRRRATAIREVDAAARFAPLPGRADRTAARRASTGRRRPAGAPAGIDPETGRPRKFAYPPNLRRRRRRRPAGGAAARGRWTSSASTTSRCAGWPSGWRRSGCRARTDPVILPRTSEGLYLLQRVRDEAHRFAITLPPAEAVQVDDRQRAGRRPRAGRDPAEGAAARTSAR